MTDPVNPTLIAAYAGDTPDPSDPSTYGVRGRALWAWETDVLLAGVNVLTGQAYTNALAAFEAAEMAYLNSNYKGAWSGLTGALNTPAVVSHSGSRWNLLNNLANVATSTPGVSADWEPYTPLSAAGVSFNPAGTGLAATTVQAAIAELAAMAAAANLQAVAGRNLIRNRNMVEVNRVRALWSYPHAIPAGVFVQDAWRAGASGCTVTSQGGGISIVAGSFVQTVFTASIYASLPLPSNTPATIAWDGTAQARVNGGAYSASPLVYTPGTMPVSFELEFGTGSVSKVRAHIGTVAPAWVAQGDIDAQREADFDYQEVLVSHRFDAGTASAQLGLCYPISRMRTGTTAGWGTATTNTNISGTPSLTLGNGRRSLTVVTTSTTSGAAQYTNTVLLNSGV